MNLIQATSLSVTMVLAAGCASMEPGDGPKGPEVVASSRATESGQYAEVGVQFTTWGDFVALVSPSRWSSPISTGGTLSWLNPVAWSEDAGRIGRIFIGEAVVVGGVAAAAATGGSGGSVGVAPGGGASTPPPPTGGGGVVPPPPL